MMNQNYMNRNLQNIDSQNARDAFEAISRAESRESSAKIESAFYAYIINRDKLYFSITDEDGNRLYDTAEKAFKAVFGWSRFRTAEAVRVGRWFTEKTDSGKIRVRTAVQGYSYSSLIEFARLIPDGYDDVDTFLSFLKVWLTDNALSTACSVRDIKRAVKRETAAADDVRTSAQVEQAAALMNAAANNSNEADPHDTVVAAALFTDLCTVAVGLDGADANTVGAFMRIVDFVKAQTGASSNAVGLNNLYNIMGVQH